MDNDLNTEVANRANANHSSDVDAAAHEATSAAALSEELLIEEISIDGMCGVY